MANKVAIVTGASGNLGQAVVKRLIEEGYYVAGTVIPNDPVVLDLPGQNFEKHVTDLMNEEESGKFVDGIVTHHGQIDVAVLTVGGFAMGGIADTKASDIMKQYRLNFETAYTIARPAFVKMMQQGSGRIFLVGSRPGLEAQQGKRMVAYGLAKSLLFRLAELMNDEARGTNVVTSVVVPGTIDTPQNRKAMPEADFNKWIKAEDIAEIIYYYCSDKARAIREPLIKAYNNA
ncbi:MAG: SDR family NAD(P)-dependent oxidoreductase [Chitinophagaceae bacterium]|nr:SDR family NAD(P)-dependent oxidoreductase [Chitinophagaceae bacterium]